MSTRPVMMLDASLPLTFDHPVHPETGELWPEKHQELVILATEYRYESDDDIREKARGKYFAAREGISFKEVPYVAAHSFMLGAAYKGAEPPPTFSVHPTFWLQSEPAVRAKFQLLAPYNGFASCISDAYLTGQSAGQTGKPFDPPADAPGKDDYGRGYCQGVFDAHPIHVPDTLPHAVIETAIEKLRELGQS